MSEDSKAAKQVLALRRDIDRTKTRLTTATVVRKQAEDQLKVADDAIAELGLDPDRDLERQLDKLITGIRASLEDMGGQLDEAESVLARR